MTTTAHDFPEDGVVEIYAHVHGDFMPLTKTIDLYAASRDYGPHKMWIAKPLEFVEHKEGEASGPPLISLSMTAAQHLMDRLWICGLRPSEGTGSAGALAAVERHLDDMRRLVFDDGRQRIEMAVKP